jgi:NADH-quinone oxidoreductase subunit J
MQPSYPLFYAFHFYLFGLVAIVASLVFVTRKSPVSAALWLVITMFSLAALYVMLDAHFIGAIQVLVYAGAIMVVFLFVVMLLNLGHPEDIADARGRGGKLAAGFIGLALLAMLASVWDARLGGMARELFVRPEFAGEQLAARNAVGAIAEPLFREQLLAFELTSVLLLVAICGAVVIGKRREHEPAGSRSTAGDADRARELEGVAP